jgi:catechol 2,3-dioxygenase-like lactoylglutathione lyase family enzyme
MVISGAHVILYSKDAEADRKFFRDVLKFPHVDAGDGWLIFALPPAELAIHPSEFSSNNDEAQSLYLMCDNLESTVKSLRRRKVRCKITGKRNWGKLASVTLPSGVELGLYEPKHPVAHPDKRIDSLERACKPASGSEAAYQELMKERRKDEERTRRRYGV